MSRPLSQRWRKWISPSLEHLKAIHVRFNVFDPHANGVKEFYFQALNRKMHRSNPKCDVSLTPIDDDTIPQVRFTFKNGFAFDYPARGKSVNEILFAMSLQNEYLINKKGMGEEEDMNDEEEEDEKK